MAMLTVMAMVIMAMTLVMAMLMMAMVMAMLVVAMTLVMETDTRWWSALMISKSQVWRKALVLYKGTH